MTELYVVGAVVALIAWAVWESHKERKPKKPYAGTGERFKELYAECQALLYEHDDLTLFNARVLLLNEYIGTQGESRLVRELVAECRAWLEEIRAGGKRW